MYGDKEIFVKARVLNFLSLLLPSNLTHVAVAKKFLRVLMDTVKRLGPKPAHLTKLYRWVAILILEPFIEELEVAEFLNLLFNALMDEVKPSLRSYMEVIFCVSDGKELTDLVDCSAVVVEVSERAISDLDVRFPSCLIRGLILYSAERRGVSSTCSSLVTHGCCTFRSTLETRESS
jgi:hypothetical protein